MSAQSLCTFFLGGEWFALESQSVQEVLRSPAITPVPLASLDIGGLMNLRGHILLAVDIRSRLGLLGHKDGLAPYCMVLRREGGDISLLVDGVGNVVDTDTELYEAPPGTLQGTARLLIRSTLKLKDQLLLILDGEQVLQMEYEERV
jgi:purine-binding chemotaxis protein CheW